MRITVLEKKSILLIQGIDTGELAKNGAFRVK